MKTETEVDTSFSNDLFEKAISEKTSSSLERVKPEYRAMMMRKVDSLESGWCRSGGRDMLMLASNNYLGLSGDKRLIQVAQTALDEWGNSTTGSRLLNGTNRMHLELERQLAEFKGTEAAAVFPSGYMANLGLLSALLAKGDLVVMDKLAHASIIDGVRLSGATLRTFRHQDIKGLERILKSVDPGISVLVVVDGIYSMDGDYALLPEITEVAHRYGARVMVDDAHATGVSGPNGRGTADHFGMAEADIVTGTLSKALGVTGGFVAGPSNLIEFMKYTARSFIYSTSMSPPATASLLEALRVMKEETYRRDNLWKSTYHLLDGLKALGFNTGPSETPIIPIILDSEDDMFEMVLRLDSDNIFASSVYYPACPKKEPRVRLSLNSNHTIEDMDMVLDSFKRHGKELGLI